MWNQLETVFRAMAYTRHAPRCDPTLMQKIRCLYPAVSQSLADIWRGDLEKTSAQLPGWVSAPSWLTAILQRGMELLAANIHGSWESVHSNRKRGLSMTPIFLPFLYGSVKFYMSSLKEIIISILFPYLELSRKENILNFVLNVVEYFGLWK